MDSKLNKNTCSGCGKPVFFAERKTSMGRDWHRSCLKCEKCGKVLNSGQHAEHKGIPYCHNPCYGALFGPLMYGYGSNVTSPANFRKSAEVVNGNDSPDASFDEDSNPNGVKCVYKTTNTSPRPVKTQQNNTDTLMPLDLFQKRHSSGNISPRGVESSENNSTSNGQVYSGLDVVNEHSGKDSGLKCVYQSNVIKPNVMKSNVIKANEVKSQDVKPHNGVKPKRAAHVGRSHSDAGLFIPTAGNYIKSAVKVRGPELFKKVKSYNEFHANKQGQTLSILEEDGNVRVQGPLRIYWGLKKPIMLKQYDDVPSKPQPKKRFSAAVSALPEIPHEADEIGPSGSPNVQRRNRGSLGLDDSVLASPSSEVVMRKSNIKKSNTVAYRGDKPNRWKRASINGHMYNYDTSVFTPVLGSCTSVTVDNKMTVQHVIKTLLEKFKVENEADEYNLCIITEHEGERALKDSDIPLLERLVIGPSDSVKLYIRDRTEALPETVNPAHIPGSSSSSTVTPVEDEDTPLPEEVEQLMDIPEPVLRGLLNKFKQDEEMEVRRLQNKYERIRRRVRDIITDKKTNVTKC